HDLITRCDSAVMDHNLLVFTQLPLHYPLFATQFTRYSPNMVIICFKQDIRSCILACKCWQPVEVGSIFHDSIHSSKMVGLQLCNGVKQDRWRSVKETCPLESTWSSLPKVILHHS